MSACSDDNGSKASELSVPPSAAESTPPIDTPASEKESVAETEKLVVVDEKDVGMIPNLKNLYGSKEDRRGRFTWHAKLPEDIGKPAEDADTLKHAIIARYSRVYGDPRRVLALHSIVIQSPLLKDLLKVVLEGYSGVTVALQRLEFSGAFEPLIHRWSRLKSEIQKLKDAACKEDAEEQAADRLKHAELLYDLLEKEFKETISSSQDMIKQNVITWELLWTIFQPGLFVYSKVHGYDRVFRLFSQRYGKDRSGNPVYWLTCQYADNSATSFGTVKLNLNIPAYQGLYVPARYQSGVDMTHQSSTKAFPALSVVPCDRLPNMEQVRAKLIERGSKVEGYAGVHYRGYNGIAWRTDPCGNMIRFSVKGRVVIDAHGWNQFNPNDAVSVAAFKTKGTPAVSGLGGGDDRSSDSYQSWSDDGPDYMDGIPMDGGFVDDERETTRQKLTDEQKLICTPIVRGYSLRDKEWLNFFVDSLHDIVFNTKAFESLVLPGDEKELILGFASTPEIYRRQFDDVVEGKGRGMVILFSGPPGTGKTLTAESVAEEMKTPLYMMSAGDLGLDASEVEHKLQRVLDMCTRWNAILLLDEADVFLEERSLHELERNKLVSIFLRVLEYYDGNMILTTNRVQIFDEAFQSRIMISIQYNELTVESRRTIWSNFLKQHDATQTVARGRQQKLVAGASEEEIEEAQLQHLKRTLPHEISDSDLDHLAKSLAINGRQIKNVLKTAQLLALRRGEGLNGGHIKLTLNVTQHLLNSTREKASSHNSIFN